MKFLFIAPRFHSNQVELVDKLITEGHSVEFITLGSSKSEDHSLVRPRILKKTIITRLLNNLFNKENDISRYANISIPNLKQLYIWLYQIQPDVVIIRGLLSPYILLALPLLMIYSKIVIYTQGPKFRNTIPLKLKVLYFFVFKVFKFNWFTPVLIKMTNPISDKTNPQIVFIPFFKNVDPRAGNRPYNINSPRFLSIGKFEKRKNILNLIDAFAQIASQFQCSLTIIGENTYPRHSKILEKVKSRIKEHDLEKKITIYENMNYEFVQNEYRKHDVYISPSYAEPASISQVEAMANGLGVICCIDNGTAHYVKHGINGLHCGRSVDDIATALKITMINSKNIEKWGRCSVEILNTELNINNAYNKLLTLCV